MSSHSFYVPESTLEAGETLVVGGDQAHHAVRVLRIEMGASVRVTDGRGRVAPATVTRTAKDRGEWCMELLLGVAEVVPRTVPMVHVYASCPKGDRLSEMVDGLSQAGASSFAPLLTEYTVVDPREGKVDRLRRVASESLKQCGRLWLLDIGEPVSLRPLLVDLKARGIQIVVGHAGGVMTAPVAAEVALLIGPEGGWSAGELAVFASQGVSMRGFGVHTMRIETAAVVASAMLVALGGR